MLTGVVLNPISGGWFPIATAVRLRLPGAGQRLIRDSSAASGMRSQDGRWRAS